jgi:dolichyl-phosphate beta-glucosyltransferase
MKKQRNRSVHLSLVIPAYNEDHRIAQTLRQVTAWLDRQPWDSEVIIVDDGSRDNTVAAAAPFLREEGNPVRLVSFPENRGKGAAVRCGMIEEASGDYRVFYDADASTPITETDKLWPCFEQGAGIVIGSRSLPDSEVRVHQAWYRETMGRVFNLFLRILGLTRLPDTQCGFKGFTRDAAETVFAKQTLDGFSFDAELLYIAKRQGILIAQTPIEWHNSARSRVHPLNDSLRMFRDILRIRWNAWRGRYR